MYKITHILIAILISYFLIPLVSPSRHYHSLSLYADNCYDWLLNLFILSKSSPSKLWSAPPCISSTKQSARPIENHHSFTFKPNLYSHLFNFSRCMLVTPPSLFLFLLIFLQLDAHMSRSPRGVWHYWRIDRYNVWLLCPFTKVLIRTTKTGTTMHIDKQILFKRIKILFVLPCTLLAATCSIYELTNE